MGYISLPSILNVILGITSYYCVILKIVILHDEIKTIQNGVFLLLLNKEQTILLIFLKTHFVQDKPKKSVFKKKTNGFFSTLVGGPSGGHLWAAST